jgi:hypothetical protein
MHLLESKWTRYDRSFNLPIRSLLESLKLSFTEANPEAANSMTLDGKVDHLLKVVSGIVHCVKGDSSAYLIQKVFRFALFIYLV